MNILIPTTNGFYRNVLTLNRSLGKRNYKLHVLTSDNRLIRLQNMLRSRYCSSISPCANPMNAPGSFLKQVRDYVIEKEIDIILPTCDSVASVLSYGKKNIPAMLPLPDYPVFANALSKSETIKAADKLNIPLPHTIEGLSIQHLLDEIMKQKMCYPLVLKPRVRGDGLMGPQVVYSKSGLQSVFEQYTSIGVKEPVYDYLNPLLQEYVRGVIYDCCVLCDRGELKCYLTQKRIRTALPYGGGGVVNETTDSPEIIEYSRLLLKKLKWSGPAQVEYIKKDDGTWVLMEVNPRFWGTLQLSVDAGIDYPFLTVKQLEGCSDELFNDLHYRIGLKERWAYPGELSSILKDKNNLFSRFVEYLNPADLFNPNVCFANQLTDPKPELFNLLKTVLSHVFNRGK